MKKYDLFKNCISAIDDLTTDLRNLTKGGKLTQDYSTMFYYLFINESQKVKCEIMDLINYKNIAIINDSLEAIWQTNSGLTSDPIRAYRGFSIKRNELINNLEYLKNALKKEIEDHNIAIIENDEKTFLLDLIYACTILQGNVLYYSKDENSRNDYIRDLLEFKGYITKDQSRHGRSSHGTNAGEIDLIVCNSAIQDKIIIEGLNLDDNTSKNNLSIKEHYNKLMTKYDTNGNRFNVLLSYVTNENFTNTVLNYKHLIEEYDFEFKAKNVKIEKIHDSTTISIIKSSHNRNGQETYIYHILTQLMK